ncbi:MAG: PAS domain S-box protein [Kiritimatiellia bacterium]
MNSVSAIVNPRPETIRILLVEDDESCARLFRAMLTSDRYEALHKEFSIQRADCLAAAIREAAKAEHDIILLDLGLPDCQGVDTFVRMRAAAPSLPIIVLTGMSDDEAALQTIQQGAQDYIVKGKADGSSLARSIRYALVRFREQQALQEENASLERHVRERTAKLDETVEALHKSEEKYRLLAENAPDIIFFLEADGACLYVSPACQPLLGYAPRELVGRSAYDITHPDDQAGLRASHAAVLAHEVSHSATARMRHQDGAYIWFEFTHRVIPESLGGGATKIEAVCRDITERKHGEEELQQKQHQLEVLVAERTGELVKANAELQAEISERKQTIGALKESERRYQELAAALPQLIWTCRPDGLCDCLSNQWLEYTGVPEAEQLGYGWLQQLHPDDREPTLAAWKTAVGKDDYRFDMEFRIRRADGVYRWFKTRAAAVYDASGAVKKWIATHTDIDDLKHTEVQERLARDVLELLNRAQVTEVAISDILSAIRKNTGFEAVGIRLHEGDDFPYYVSQGFPETFVVAERYLCVRDAAGNCVLNGNGNPELECMCGNILSGRPHPSLPCFSAGGSFWTNSTTGLLATTTAAVRQTLTRNRCNREGYESVALIPLRAAGKIVGLLQCNDHRPNLFTPATILFLERLGACIGIAFFRLQEAQQLHALMANLHRTNKELEQFAYAASHDLQEPLRKVASFTQLLAERYGDKLDNDAREFIGYAVDGAHRMQELIQALLAYSRVGTRSQPFAPVDCEIMLAQSLANLDLAIAESSALVTHERLPTVMGDALQLVQLFQHLISNAIKFRGADTPHVHVTAARQAKEWIFQVRDNGLGMEPQYFERIFAVFQRLHSREEYPGTGIGLAICKKIVERHGGRIWVESASGAGSTFSFSIPDR